MMPDEVLVLGLALDHKMNCSFSLPPHVFLWWIGGLLKPRALMWIHMYIQLITQDDIIHRERCLMYVDVNFGGNSIF
jgi:hypothetical protein